MPFEARPPSQASHACATRPAALPDVGGCAPVVATSSIDIVATVGSLGGPEAIREIVSGLPAWFPAAVVVVQHRTPMAQHITVDLLRRAARLEVVLAREDEHLRPGIVYVTPADRQLLIDQHGCFAAAILPAHPAADPLFISVAKRFEERAVGVVLSGTNADGAAGVIALKGAGGRIIVQNRQTARCFTMPSAAIATGCVDLALPVGRIAHALVSLAAWPGASSLLQAPLASWANLD